MSAICISPKILTAKAGLNKKPLTFGDFVAGGYRAWGKRKATGIIQLAVQAHMVEFRKQPRPMMP
jgi:hypothetical protein